jgi:predicted ABC-type exoprotein transport system permease subunit
VRKKSHREQALKRKNFLPTLLVTVLLWILLGGLIYFVDPGTFGVIYLFFLLIFACFLFTFSLIFANSRRGMVATIASTLFLILFYLGVGNILNLILIVAIAVCIELYFTLR